MSESTEQTTNNETTETTAYEAVEYVHGANIKFPDGKERGFFPNSRLGEKDGLELAQKLCAELNELSSVRTALEEAKRVETSLRADLDGTSKELALTRAKLEEAEKRLATIAAATANE